MGDQDKSQKTKCLKTRGLEPRILLMNKVKRGWEVTVTVYVGIGDTTIVTDALPPQGLTQTC